MDKKLSLLVYIYLLYYNEFKLYIYIYNLKEISLIGRATVLHTVG